MKIMQGDSYPIPVDITQDGVAVTPETVDEVEITVGEEIRKLYTAGGVTYENGAWYFLLTQQETFSLKGNKNVYVRLKYPGTGYTLGIKAGTLSVDDIPQKVVL